MKEDTVIRNFRTVMAIMFASSAFLMYALNPSTIGQIHSAMLLLFAIFFK